MSDQSLVMLKQVKKHMNPYEVELTQYVTSVSDPRNHCVPLLDVLPVPDDPDTTILVMPLLRECDSPAWDTLGEAISFLRQVFEVSPQRVTQDPRSLRSFYTRRACSGCMNTM